MKSSVKFGLIYGGVAVAIPLLLFGLGLEKDESIQKINPFINILIPAIIISLGIRQQRTLEGNGFISFGSGFSCGMTIAFIGGIISTVFTYLYFTILNPGMITYIRMKQEEEMIKRGLAESEVANMSETMQVWTSPGMMCLFVFLMTIILGLVISLIASAILKKENPAEEMR